MTIDANTGPMLDQAVARGTGHLRQERRPDGSWQDFVSSSALATGVCLLSLWLADAHEFSERVRRGCAWLRETQHEDGGWGDAVVDPGNLNSTAFAMAALHMCDRDQSTEALRRGRTFIERAGGMAALRDRSRCSLSPVVLTLWAVAGLCSWKAVPRLPLELALFPRAMWRRVAFTIPAVFSLGMLHSLRKTRPLLARAATRRALDYLAGAQGSNGGYQESPLLNGVVYVGLRAANQAGTVVDRCLDYVLGTQRTDGSWTCERDLELSVTTLIVDALDAVDALETPQDTAGWLLERQLDARFDPTGCPAGAWSWGYPSGWPDTEDTAGAVNALLTLGVSPGDRQIERGIGWLRAMQNRDGSWGMFVRNSRVTIDRPCPALTARVLMTFYRRDRAIGGTALRALDFLGSAQHPDGSFHSLWFRNHTYATAVVLEAHTLTGFAEGPIAAGCRRWLLTNQNDDGSWGGRRGDTGTAEETGTALAALTSAGVKAPAPALEKAAHWLVNAQQANGGWAPSVLGVYYHSLVYSSDHLATAFALRGLGRYRQHREG